MIEITFCSVALETRNNDKFHVSVIDKDLIYELYDLHFDNSILSFFYEFSCAVHVPDDKMMNSMITLYDSWLIYLPRFSSKSSLLHMKICWNPKDGHKSCFCEDVVGLRPTDASSHKHGLYWLSHTMFHFWWNLFWMNLSLDETVFGRKCHEVPFWDRFWMKVQLDDTVFGWKCKWMTKFLDESVSGWIRFWMKMCSTEPKTMLGLHDAQHHFQVGDDVSFDAGQPWRVHHNHLMSPTILPTIPHWNYRTAVLFGMLPPRGGLCITSWGASGTISILDVFCPLGNGALPPWHPHRIAIRPTQEHGYGFHHSSLREYNGQVHCIQSHESIPDSLTREPNLHNCNFRLWHLHNDVIDTDDGRSLR